MPEGTPEKMTRENFDESDYRDKLLDDGYSQDTARMLSERKKEELNKMILNGDEISMIRWHRDQIMKLLGGNDLEKMLYIDEL